MLEILQKFEHSAAGFNPAVLISSGIICVLIGLVLWLAGTIYAKPISAVTGAILAAVTAWVASAHNYIITLISAAVGAVLAVILEKLIISLIAVIITIAFTFSAIWAFNNTTYSTDTAEIQSYRNLSSFLQTAPQQLNARETTAAFGSLAADLSTEIQAKSKEMPPVQWIVVAITATVIITVSILLHGFVTALGTSALGTILIFSGLIILLLFKESGAITAIYNNYPLYGAIFIAMVCLGTVVQLLFCPKKKKQKVVEKESKSSMKDGKEGQNS